MDESRFVVREGEYHARADEKLVDICNVGRTQTEKSSSPSSVPGTSNGIYQAVGSNHPTPRRDVAESTSKPSSSSRRVFDASIQKLSPGTDLARERYESTIFMESAGELMTG